MQNNSLVFGRDSTEGICSINLKNDECSIYTEALDGTIGVETFPYSPFVLSNYSLKARSERLKGDQYYKYMTSTTCEKFESLQQEFQRDLWLPRNIEETVTLVYGMTYFKGRQVKDISILSFDIETNGLHKNADSKIFIISNTFRKLGKTIQKLFSIDDYESELAMMDAWIAWVQEVNPSVMCGHNIMGYDLPYMSHCYNRHTNRDMALGRDQSEIVYQTKASKFRKDGTQSYDYFNAKITGRELIDTFFLSIKYDIARNFPSYGLKPIIKYLGLEKEGRTFIDASRIADQWNNLELRAKIKAYAIEDADDALKLYDMMIPASFYLSQSVPMTFQAVNNTATGGQINQFLARAYIQDGYSIPRTTKLKDKVEGGISFGVPGLYKNMVKLDLRSAYPSQILRFKLFDKQKDPKGYFYEMVKHFTEERFALKDQYKKTGDLYFKDREQTAKVFINSAYGALNTPYLNFNSPELAAKITYETREIIDLALKWASGKDKNYWIHLFREKTGQIDE